MIRQVSTIAVAAVALAFASPAFAGAASDKSDAKPKGGPAKQFERMDRNNDGAIDADEVKQQLSKFMKRADKNGDGVIDADEIKALKERAAKKSEKAADNVEKKLKKLDTDGDGKISETEALTRPAWFDRADANKDGKVTKAEIDDLMAKRKARDEKKAGKKANDAKDTAADDDDAGDDDE
ncbi:EF-hand domain-containing protein [Chelatococcus sambhunathii]|uniref:EF-hand domain-containing protein n=1 Tax=Chelatococcus sambhunathii TaxID=363953 RepID=A0ABU1DIF3_9HYPH|nr:EF-hand domain-containing protein [Chelatococcus sambhunathii]MDR4307892.1 EF-hand domain-containing protein [Chelatococcus sambhunathii]